MVHGGKDHFFGVTNMIKPYTKTQNSIPRSTWRTTKNTGETRKPTPFFIWNHLNISSTGGFLTCIPKPPLFFPIRHGLLWDLHRIPGSSRKWRRLQVGHQHLHRWLQGFGSPGRPTGRPTGHWREALGRRGCRGQVKVACWYIYIYIICIIYMYIYIVILE